MATKNATRMPLRRASATAVSRVGIQRYAGSSGSRGSAGRAGAVSDQADRVLEDLHPEVLVDGKGRLAVRQRVGPQIAFSRRRRSRRREGEERNGERNGEQPRDVSSHGHAPANRQRRRELRSDR